MSDQLPRSVAPLPAPAVPMRVEGFDLHAGVSIAAHDRDGLERLCRYLCRPPLSHERLEQIDEEHVSLERKTPWSNGTTHVVLSFDELLQRLCALVPRPGTHRVGYHGVLASAARHRSEVVPSPAEPDEPAVPDEDGQNVMFGEEDAPPPRRKTVRRLLWVELLQRVLGIDALRCPKCGGRVRVIGFLDHHRGQGGQSDPGRSRTRERSARGAAISGTAGVRHGRVRVVT